MSSDDHKLLKHGLFGAVLVAGFWLLIILMRNRVVTVIGMLVWLALLYVIFYRDTRKKNPN
ncbi:MAG: hypothetical protein WBE13_04355 [Candidatus Acidiferrum sp.]